MSVSAEERERIFERAWNEGGGFNVTFGTFNDLALREAANEAAASFIRRKIAKIVRDPKKRDLVTPKDYYAMRTLCDDHYFEALDRDNVSVVDIKKRPILEFTETGVRTDEGEIALDMIIFAPGFDELTPGAARPLE